MSEWQAADWLTFRPIAQDTDVMRYIDSGQLWSDERIRHFVQAQIQEARAYGFCLWKLTEKVTSTLIGFCGLQHYEAEIEIGWWLAKSYWGKGLATEAARVALLDAFQRIRLPRVIAMAQPENRASIHIMEKLGMKFERNAVRNRIHVVVYGIANTPAGAGG
jgi:RimJ/RimL family protein N-acetyltransferase